MKIVLFVHIVCGAASLIFGCLSLIYRKGSNQHKQVGLIFVYVMSIVGLSALILALFGDMNFLTYIAVFSLYQVVSGRRAILRKYKPANIIDVLLISLGLLNGILMITMFNVVTIVFGVIQLSLSFNDLLFFIRIWRKIKLPASTYIIRHIGLMVGAFIASTTAFAVVNFQLTSMAWLPWIVPTVIGVPFIAFWSRKYVDKVEG